MVNLYIHCNYPDDVNKWFEQSLNYSELKVRILNNALHSLSPTVRTFIIQHLQKVELLHQAASQGDEEFVKAMVELGVDVNTLDSNGLTIADYVNPPEKTSQGNIVSFNSAASMGLSDAPQLFLWLVERGLKPSIANNSNLGIISQRAYDSRWNAILIDAIKLTNKNDIIDQQINLEEPLKSAKNDPVLDEKLKEIFLQMLLIHADPTYIIPFFIHDESTYIPYFGKLIENNLIKETDVVKVFGRKDIVLAKQNAAVVDRLSAFYNPSWLRGCKLSNALFFQNVLQSETLDDLAKVIGVIGVLQYSYQFEPESANELTALITRLEEKENRRIWQNEEITESGWMLLQVLGLLNSIDSNNRTVLFHAPFILFLQLNKYTQWNLDVHHRDTKGCNALEHHLQHTNLDQLLGILHALSNMGLDLTDEMPYGAIVRKHFPKDLWLQHNLFFLLHNPKKSFVKRLGVDVQYRLRHAVFSDPSLHERLGKYFDEPSHLSTLKPSFLAELGKRVSLNAQTIGYLKDLIPLWGEENVPMSAFTLIPDSPWVSFAIAALEKQHQNLKPNSKLVPIEKLFPESLFLREEMIELHSYAFEHPECFAALMDYMQLKSLNIYTMGYAQSKYAKIAYHLIRCSQAITHISEKVAALPPWHQAIVRAFNATVPSVPALLELDNQPIQMLSRTAVIQESPDSSLALKFLKEGESYASFSQESSVTSAFQKEKERFKSTFHQPIGVFTAAELPENLARLLSNVKIAKPPTFYAYRSDPKLFQYPEDLNETSYLEMRPIYLEDGAKMVRMGLHPDVASLFHNQHQERKYVLLIDLFRLMYGRHNFGPSLLGSGRLDQPFAKVLFSNARPTGLTDLRDASPLFQGFSTTSELSEIRRINEVDRLYFMQMNGLASLFLVDMLILTLRLQKEGALHWQNLEEMARFGNLLAQGFAHIAASYSEKSYEPSLHFALHCGIDWNRAARQIAFWTDTSSEGYPGYLLKGKLPLDLYEKGAKIRILAERLGINFDPIKGCSSEGNQDIGVFNGPCCLEEFTKACYAFINSLFLAE